MKYKLVVIILLICCAFLSNGQDYYALRQDHFNNREIKLSYYNNDTMRAYFNHNWLKCTPEKATYYAEAYNVGGYWLCSDYYVEQSSIYHRTVYKDQELKNKEGQYFQFTPEGFLELQGQFFNNKKTGWWVGFNFRGNQRDSVFYINGNLAGKSTSYYLEKKIAEIREFDKKGMGTGHIEKYNEGGFLFQTGYYAAGMLKDSVWNCYFVNGKVSYTEIYNKGKLKKTSCYDINEVKLSNCIRSRWPVFNLGMSTFQGYANQNIPYPEAERKKKSKGGMVIVQLKINPNGMISDVKVTKSLSPDFDKAVVDFVQNMPPCQPEIEYNQPISTVLTIPITFSEIID